MDINNKLIIKVQFNDEIRKMPIHNEDITYDELIIMMERVFKHKLNAEDEIIIKYKDEDNDLITISDDSDLAFAIEGSNILKLSLTIENNTEEESKKLNDLRSDEIRSIRKEVQIIRDHANKLLDKLAICNGDASINTVTSGRTSAALEKGFHEIGGKEFDPLSITNHSQITTAEKSETSNSIISNNRDEDFVNKLNSYQTRQNNQELKSDSNEIHSPVNFTKNPSSMSGPAQSTGYNNVVSQSQMQPSNMQFNKTIQHNSPNQSMSPSMGVSNISSNMGEQNIPPKMGGQNIPPNMGGQNIPPNMGGQNMPPNMGGQNMPHNMGGQNMPPNMGGQNMPPNMGGQNMAPNMGGQNMAPNMGGQNMPPNMGGQNMPPNMGGQNMPPNMGGQNMPPNMGGQNIPPNMGGQNMPPNMGGQNMPPNMGGQNMPPNMGGQNMPPNMGGQNMPPKLGGQNMPPNMGGANIPKTIDSSMHNTPNAPSAFTGNPNPSGFTNPQSMQGQQRQFYPSVIQPPRLSPSNFQGSAVGNPGGIQNRPPGSYFSPQNQASQFNPAMSQPSYGYQSQQK